MISLDFKVVGVSFVDSYPANLQCLWRVMQDRYKASSPVHPVRVALVRNPDNEHDPNAVEVHVDRIGMLGHVPRRVAADLAPCLDSEDDWGGYVDHVLLHNGDPRSPMPGVKVHIYEKVSVQTADTHHLLPKAPTAEEIERALAEMDGRPYRPSVGSRGDLI